MYTHHKKLSYLFTPGPWRDTGWKGNPFSCQEADIQEERNPGLQLDCAWQDSGPVARVWGGPDVKGKGQPEYPNLKIISVGTASPHSSNHPSRCWPCGVWGWNHYQLVEVFLHKRKHILVPMSSHYYKFCCFQPLLSATAPSLLSEWLKDWTIRQILPKTVPSPVPSSPSHCD